MNWHCLSDSGSSQVHAFSVTSNHNQVIPERDVVQYNTKLVNDHGHFELQTGVYTVPQSGYYIFHFSRFVKVDVKSLKFCFFWSIIWKRLLCRSDKTSKLVLLSAG